MAKKKDTDVIDVVSEDVAVSEGEVAASADVAVSAASAKTTKAKYQVVSGKDVLFNSDDLLAAKQFAQKSSGKLVA